MTDILPPPLDQTPSFLDSKGFGAGADILKKHLPTLPEQPGVYRMINKNGDVLYVGKAKNLRKRVSSYTQKARLPNRLQRMVSQIRHVEIVVTRTESEALLLEANFIQRFLPPFNVLLRDDKSYPYILITRDHDFPQILKHRGSKNRKGWYFGPFASAAAVAETIIQIQRGFMLRNCSDSVFATRTRPCLQYHIKRCTAPCAQKVSLEDYGRQVQDACDFLKGRNIEIQQRLAAEMQTASDHLEFERAAKLRDRIKVLTSMQSRQDIHVTGLEDADVFAICSQAGKTAIQVFFFRNGRNYGARTFYPTHDPDLENAEILASFLVQFYADKLPPPLLLLNCALEDHRLLEQAFADQARHPVALQFPKAGVRKRLIDHALQNAKEGLARKLSERSEQTKLLARVAEIFGLGEAPHRIEVYDNSHVSGSHAVGGMIAAGTEGFLKKTYRKFNIRNQAAAGDDYAMMDEVLRRRFQRLIKEDPQHQSDLWPDLILIDGGQGQLTKAKDVLEDLGLMDIPIVGIAKGPDRNAGRERFFMMERTPFSLTPDDPVLYYLQRLRDEAHRYAIGTHRARRIKALGQSGLEDIPGIGSTRKKALLHHFGSAKAVQTADIQELSRAPGISLNIAKKIHDYFHERG